MNLLIYSHVASYSITIRVSVPSFMLVVPLDGYVDCFQSCVIQNKAAVNILLEHMCEYVCKKFLEVELLSQRHMHLEY